MLVWRWVRPNVQRCKCKLQQGSVSWSEQSPSVSIHRRAAAKANSPADYKVHSSALRHPSSIDIGQRCRFTPCPGEQYHGTLAVVLYGRTTHPFEFRNCWHNIQNKRQVSPNKKLRHLDNNNCYSWSDHAACSQFEGLNNLCTPVLETRVITRGAALITEIKVTLVDHSYQLSTDPDGLTGWSRHQSHDVDPRATSNEANHCHHSRHRRHWSALHKGKKRARNRDSLPLIGHLTGLICQLVIKKAISQSWSENYAQNHLSTRAKIDFCRTSSAAAEIMSTLGKEADENAEQVSNSSANTSHLPNVWPMLGQRRRRWANIDRTLGGCVVFAGIVQFNHYHI